MLQHVAPPIGPHFHIGPVPLFSLHLGCRMATATKDDRQNQLPRPEMRGRPWFMQQEVAAKMGIKLLLEPATMEYVLTILYLYYNGKPYNYGQTHRESYLYMYVTQYKPLELMKLHFEYPGVLVNM